MKRLPISAALLGTIVLTGLTLKGEAPASAETCSADHYVCDDKDSIMASSYEIDGSSSYALSLTSTSGGTLPTGTLEVENRGHNSTYNIAIYSHSTQITGSNYGIYSKAQNAVYNNGVYGWAAGGTGTNYAVRGYASGTGSYGGHFTASGLNSYAGKFVGNVDVTGDMTVDDDLAVFGRTDISGYLDVGGDFTSACDVTITNSAKNFKYDPERTFYYSVPGALCVDTQSNPSDSVYRQNGYAYIGNGSAPLYGSISCPVHLPDGARITEFRCGVFDSDSTYDITIRLKRFNMTGNVQNISAISSSGTSGDQQITEGGLDYDVNKSAYSYFIYTGWNASSFGSIKLHMCRITYGLTTIIP